jgi:hypothetical protein
MQNKSFFSVLFDLSFTEFITTRIVKFLFIVSIILSAIGALLLVGAGLKEGFVAGVASVLSASVLFVFYVLLSRIYLEILVAVFRIAENTAIMAANNKD